MNTRFRTSAGGAILKGFVKISLNYDISAFVVVTDSEMRKCGQLNREKGVLECKQSRGVKCSD